MTSRTATRPVGGFTLMELLVVISIITLLIALLMPNLGKSREVAHRVHCGSGLRQLGVGVTTYTDDQRGFLPTHFGGGAHPFTTYWMNQHSLGKLVRANLGLVLTYVPNPHTFYDISLANDPVSALSYNGPDNPWNDSKGDSIYRLRSSYSARSLEVERGTSGGLLQWKIKDYHNRVIYADFTGVDHWNGAGIINGKIMAPHNRSGSNALFEDNSVTWIPFAPLEKYRAINTSTPTKLDYHNWYKIMDTRP